MVYSIFPPEEMIEDFAVALPLSKSISTRCIILDALTQNSIDNSGAIARCDDTAVMQNAIKGYASAPAGTHLSFDLKDCGAALRFLMAYFSISEGCDVTLCGSPRLCRRPIGILVDALRECGAEIKYEGEEGYAPITIKGSRLTGGEVAVDATVSSQFISALMMIAPLTAEGLTIRFEGEPVSMPYILLTAGMIAERGIACERQPLQVAIQPGSYKPFRQESEGDWSAAAFWMEICALSSGWFTMTNLKADSMQGDRRSAELFECLGVATCESETVAGGVDISPSPEVYGRLSLDLSDTPDLAPALAVTATMIGVPFRFTGLQTLGIKESDRLEAISTEMKKLGRCVEKIGDSVLEWDGKTVPVGIMPVLSAHGDHRIAMALAPICLYIPGIIIEGLETVDKSYPEFPEHLRAAGFRLVEVEIDQEGNVKRTGGDFPPERNEEE